MSADRMTFPFMSNHLKQGDMAPEDMSCFTHCLRDILLFHGIQNVRRVLAQPLSIVCTANKNRDISLASLTETYPSFQQGLQGSWRLTVGYQEAIAAIRTCQEEGKIALFRTNWMKVPYSPAYKKRTPNIHNGLALAYSQESDEFSIADRSHGLGPADDPRFLDNRGTIPGEEMRAAFNDFFAWFDYEVSEPAYSWEQELKLLIKASVQHMHSHQGWISPHQEFGLQALTHFARFLQKLELEEALHSHQLRNLLRGLIPQNIQKCVITNHKLFFSVLAESYSLEEWGLQTLVTQTQQHWYRLALVITNFGREISEGSRQACLREIDQIIELEQAIIDRLMPLL